MVSYNPDFQLFAFYRVQIERRKREIFLTFFIRKNSVSIFMSEFAELRVTEKNSSFLTINQSYDAQWYNWFKIPALPNPLAAEFRSPFTNIALIDSRADQVCVTIHKHDTCAAIFGSTTWGIWETCIICCYICSVSSMCKKYFSEQNFWEKWKIDKKNFPFAPFYFQTKHYEKHKIIGKSPLFQLENEPSQDCLNTLRRSLVF